VALGAVEALLVPHGALGQLLFGRKDHTTATWTSLAGWGLDGGRVGVCEWTVVSDFLFTAVPNFKK
jgi:hypothetical protein